MPSWAEELCGVMRTGDVPAVTEWRRAKSIEFCNLLADLIHAQADASGKRKQRIKPPWRNCLESEAV